MWEIHDGTDELQADEAHVLRMISGGLPQSVMVRRVGEDVWRDIRSHAPFAMAFQRQQPAPQPAPQAYAPQPQPYYQPTGEAPLYNDTDVTITTARAVFNGTTYAVANITSVRQWTEPRALAFLLLALFFGGVGFLVLIAGGTTVAVFLGLLPSASLFGIYFGLLKERHWVLLVTAGAESRAFWSHDPARTSQVLAALNHAITNRR